MSAAYARQWDLAGRLPLGFENTFALVMRGGQARAARDRDGISELARHQELRPGFGYEFVDAADGFPGLAAAYGLAFAARPADDGPRVALPGAGSEGKVDVVAGNSTDGLIAAMGSRSSRTIGATFLRTRRRTWSRGAVWKDARVRGALEELSGTLTAAGMWRLNQQVAGEHRRTADVARDFLDGLPKPR